MGPQKFGGGLSRGQTNFQGGQGGGGYEFPKLINFAYLPVFALKSDADYIEVFSAAFFCECDMICLLLLLFLLLWQLLPDFESSKIWVR